MKILQNLRWTEHFLINVVVAAALSGCAISRQQPSAANTSRKVTAATPATARAARTKPVATRGAPPAEAETSSSAVILSQIHQADLKEIAIGKIADQKASTSEVRHYADQLVEDHQTVDQTVLATAQRANVHFHDTAAPRAGPDDSAHVNVAEEKLRSANNAIFDRLFLQQTSADDHELIRALKEEREDASDDAIEALIDKILPILEQHEELAQILLKKEQV